MLPVYFLLMVNSICGRILLIVCDIALRGWKSPFRKI